MLHKRLNYDKGTVESAFFKCDALSDVVPFVQLKKREKHPWRGVNFSKVAAFSTPLWVIFTFFKLYIWHQIAQRTTNVFFKFNMTFAESLIKLFMKFDYPTNISDLQFLDKKKLILNWFLQQLSVYNDVAF